MRHGAVSYTHLRAHETRHDLVCRLLLDEKLGVPLLISFILIVGGVALAQSHKSNSEEAS